MAKSESVSIEIESSSEDEECVGEADRLHKSNHYELPKLSYKNKPINFRKCNRCRIPQPLRAKHCETCKRCVRKFDHHCPWLGNCVGERNHKYFWSFMITECFVISWTFYVHCSLYRSAIGTDWLRMNLLLLIIAPILVISFFVTFTLLCIHSYLLTSNSTTWEFLARSRITYLKELDETENPFDEGCIRNSLKFFCRCSIEHWEKYFTSVCNVISKTNGDVEISKHT